MLCSPYPITGTQIGTILAFQVAGFLSGSPLGWPAAFWFCGILCFFCFGLLLWLGSATPHEHPRISDAELMYITGESNMDVPRVSVPFGELPNYYLTFLEL